MASLLSSTENVDAGSLPVEEERSGVSLWRWTRDNYYRAAESGLFDLTARLELLDGEIIQHLSPHKSSHSTSVLFAQSALAEAANQQSLHIRTQMPITLNDRSEPEPDLTLAVGTAVDYAEYHPFPPEISLLIEVSDTTLRIDRTRKAATYARAGIREYCIINLGDRQLEIYRDPAPISTGFGYKTALIHDETDTVNPLFALGSAIAVADLLPPASAQQQGKTEDFTT